ncbi:PREDICTED: high-affinity lysophosphatidic acid receptor-like [Priapulus caudatus]|uniref:High-affinity lysophosphatidic acid receptor-like n=1 Tax=Priapulus caudatus TaxID=37621 RepID=A0ABM1EKG7_PRICU|nr:PREDICTED: high-affinity lysophosphatidic acid receptor-like [Priapulus caudatus]
MTIVTPFEPMSMATTTMSSAPPSGTTDLWWSTPPEGAANATTLSDDLATLSLPAKVILTTLIVVFITMAFFGNVMVILTVLRHRGMRTRTNMFIVNLAVADALVAVLVMPFSANTVVRGTWTFSRNFCMFNAFTMAFFLIASIHTLMYISLHKYISITRPFSRFMTPRRIGAMIVCVWAWAAVVGITLFVWTTAGYKPGAMQCGPVIPRTQREKAHSLFVTITCFACPLAIMIYCYFGIFREIRRHSARLKQHTHMDPDHVIEQQKRITMTLLLVLFCFILCWLPYIVYSNYAALVSRDKEHISPIWNAVKFHAANNLACCAIYWLDGYLVFSPLKKGSRLKGFFPRAQLFPSSGFLPTTNQRLVRHATTRPISTSQQQLVVVLAQLPPTPPNEKRSGKRMQLGVSECSNYVCMLFK